jgi:hypothetical protein
MKSGFSLQKYSLWTGSHLLWTDSCPFWTGSNTKFVTLNRFKTPSEPVQQESVLVCKLWKSNKEMIHITMPNQTKPKICIHLVPNMQRSIDFINWLFVSTQYATVKTGLKRW